MINMHSDTPTLSVPTNQVKPSVLYVLALNVKASLPVYHLFKHH